MPEAAFQAIFLSSWWKRQPHHQGVQIPQGERQRNPKYSKKDYKGKSREVNLLEKEASHQRAKYRKYKKLNKAFSKNNTRVILDDPLESYSSSSSEGENFTDEGEKNYIAYDS